MSKSLDFLRDRNKDLYRVFKLFFCFLEYAKKGQYSRNWTPFRCNVWRDGSSFSRAPEKGLVSAVNECRCIDFVSDQLYNMKRFRALTVLDTFSFKMLSYLRGQIDQGRTGLRGTGKNQGCPRAASTDQGWQRSLVHLPCAGCLGVLQQD